MGWGSMVVIRAMVFWGQTCHGPGLAGKRPSILFLSHHQECSGVGGRGVEEILKGVEGWGRKILSV